MGSLGDGVSVPPKSFGSISHSVNAAGGGVVVPMTGTYGADNCGVTLKNGTSIESAAGAAVTAFNCSRSGAHNGTSSGRRQLTAAADPVAGIILSGNGAHGAYDVCGRSPGV